MEQGQCWAREGRLEECWDCCRGDFRAGENMGNGGKRAELIPLWRPPTLMLLDDSQPLCLGVNWPEGFVLYHMGDTRILAGLNRKNKGFSLVCDKWQRNLPCPGGVNHVSRVCYNLPVPSLSGCRPGSGQAKRGECLEAVLT